MNEDNIETAKLLLKSVNEVLQVHFDKERYLSKLPNNNNDIDNAMATLIMGGSGLLVSFAKAFDDDDEQVMAMCLRAMIETHANVNHILSSANSLVTAKKFNSTTEETSKLFYAIAKGEVLKTKRWTNKTISERIKVLSLNYFPLWIFLSSYVHVDAGYMAAHTSGYKNKLGFVFSGMLALQFYGIFDLLDKYEITKSEESLHWLKALKDVVEKDKIKQV